MNLTKYRHIIWDWNGTLVDDIYLCIEIINRILSERDLPTVDHKRYREVFDFPIIKYYTALGFDFDKEPFEVIATNYIVEYSDRYRECGLHKGALELIKGIESAKKGQSILSASKQDTLTETIDFYGIDKHFMGVIGLDDHYAKSKVESGRQWIQELGIDPKEVVLIGDTIHDYDVACAMGCDCILVAGGHQDINRLRQCKVPVIESLEELVI